jgi:hypothetical protein
MGMTTNKELHLCTPHQILFGDQIKKSEMAGNLVCMWERRGVYTVLLGKFGRPRRRWEDNIKIDLKKWDGGGLYWIDLPQDRSRWWAVVNVVMKVWVP